MMSAGPQFIPSCAVAIFHQKHTKSKKDTIERNFDMVQHFHRNVSEKVRTLRSDKVDTLRLLQSIKP